MIFLRQTDIIEPAKLDALNVTIIGLGGIGSPTAEKLARMGVKNITLYDSDEVNEHNRPYTVYRRDQVGRKKTEALADVLFSAADDLNLRWYNCLVNNEFQDLNGIVISGLDSMASRKQVWQAIMNQPKQVELYIDGRMAAQIARILIVNPNIPTQKEWYESTLFNDTPENAIPCSARAIGYNTGMISSLIAEQIKCYANNEPLTKEQIFDYTSKMWVIGK